MVCGVSGGGDDEDDEDAAPGSADDEDAARVERLEDGAAEPAGPLYATRVPRWSLCRLPRPGGV